MEGSQANLEGGVLPPAAEKPAAQPAKPGIPKNPALAALLRAKLQSGEIAAVIDTDPDKRATATTESAVKEHEELTKKVKAVNAQAAEKGLTEAAAD